MKGTATGLVVALALIGTAAMAGCNGVPGPCVVTGGSYHLLLPEGATGGGPAVVFLHGYGGDGASVLANRPMLDEMLQRGYAVIAPDGQPREQGAGRSWDFHPDRPARRDEIAFLIAVADDAAARYGLDRNRMLLAGFSIGGSMTSYLACAAPDAFAAYAPVAGSFWRPHPESCAGPVRLLHTHGTADQTVPMAGRQIAPGVVQGNVIEAMEIWRLADRCRSDLPDAETAFGRYRVRSWTDCAPGARLDLALHAGGHTIPEDWARLALDWFDRR